MRVCGIAIKFGLAVCLLVAAGCDSANFQFATTSNTNPGVETGNGPFAVLLIAPTQEWFADAQSFAEHSDASKVWNGQLQKMFGSVDKQRHSALFFVASGKSGSEPVIYLPVENYDRFLDKLARQGRLKRAVASSFSYGHYRFLVKRVGDYAVIGTSLEGIKKCPQVPEAYFKGMPKDFDFSFRLISKSANKRERIKLVRSINDSFGTAFAKMVVQCDSFDCGLRFDSTSKIEFHAQVSPVPENSDEIQASMSQAVAAKGWNASTEIQSNSLVFDIALPSAQANSAWAHIQPAVLNAFESQLTVLANRPPTTGPFGLPMNVDSGNVYLPGSSSGGSGGAACGRRRG